MTRAIAGRVSDFHLKWETENRSKFTEHGWKPNWGLGDAHHAAWPRIPADSCQVARFCVSALLDRDCDWLEPSGDVQCSAYHRRRRFLRLRESAERFRVGLNSSRDDGFQLYLCHPSSIYVTTLCIIICPFTFSRNNNISKNIFQTLLVNRYRYQENLILPDILHQLPWALIEAANCLWRFNNTYI